MDRQEAIGRIARAGKGVVAIEATHQLTEAATRTYRNISENAQWSEQHKTQQLAVAYSDYRRQADQTLSDLAERAARTEQGDAERVFGVTGLGGDSASLMISRRDAGDRVAGIFDSRELGALLSKATRSGDEVLARAIAERATEIGDVDTMNAFLDDRPSLEQAGERLWSAQQQGGLEVMALGLQLLPAKPSELDSMNEWEIDRLVHEPIA